MVQRIPVALDGSPLAETILTYMGALAKGLGAKVLLLHVVHLSEDIQQEEVSRVLQPSLEQARTQTHEYLRSVTQRLSDAGIMTHCRIVIGEAATEIVRCAQHEHMDMIAIATHGCSGLQRWFYGSVAEKVLHPACTPLLLDRLLEQHDPAFPDLSVIIVPLDGSPLAETGLLFAETIAARCNVPLVLLRVIKIFSIAFADLTGMAGTNSQLLLDGWQNAADRYLNTLADSLRGKGVNVQTATPMGAPANKIVEYAHAHIGVA